MRPLNKNDVCMNRIKQELEAKGISQTELANRLGKTFNYGKSICHEQSAASYSCIISDSGNSERRCAYTSYTY